MYVSVRILNARKLKGNLVHNKTLTITTQKRAGVVPNAKQKVKIAENMFPMMAETKRVPTLLTLSTKFPKEPIKGH